MIQYYQLTPDILLEYVYEDDSKLDEDGVRGNEKDIYDGDNATILLKSNAFGTKYLCFKDESEGLDSISNLVLPLNNTETQFVIAQSDYQKFYEKNNASNIFSSKNGSGYIYEDTEYDKSIRENSNDDSNGSCDVKYDKCIIHFTSRNYFGSYDSLIFQAYVYMKNKSKLYFASFLFKKTSNLELKAEHLLYNEKLYTTQIEFDIPSVSAILCPNQDENDIEQKKFNDALKAQNIELLENTPIGINVYGVTGSSKGVDNYIRLRTLKINSISIPYIYNRLDEIYVNIYEACDDKLREDGDIYGDFYYIDPEMGSNISFVDYIERMGEDIRAYMIMHELCLKEMWVDSDGISHSEITHKEYHIIDIHEDDEDEYISNRFDAKIKYRPICIRGGANYRATIIDTIKIINTVDNSSYEVMGSLEIINPHKYGAKLKKLNMNGVGGEQVRPIVNVYNKKVSGERNGSDGTNNSGNSSSSSSSAVDNAIILNKGGSGGFVIENNTQNITSFIECTNIGVSILEISPDDIN